MMQVRPERGSMLVEMVFLMVLLMVPLLYLVGTLGRLQAGAYASSAAARESGRAYVTAATDGSAPGRGVAAAGLVFDAFGFDQGQGSVSISCALDPCLTPGGRVRVDSSLDVAVPLVPDFMSAVIPTTITMTSSHTEPVDEFREG